MVTLRELVFPFLASINCKDLVLFVMVKTVAMVFYRSVRELARSPNQAALFSTFLTHE